MNTQTRILRISGICDKFVFPERLLRQLAQGDDQQPPAAFCRGGEPDRREDEGLHPAVAAESRRVDAAYAVKP